MAFLQFSFLSSTLGINTDLNIILPDLMPDEVEQVSKGNIKFQTLYLLHGYSGDYSDWIRFSSIERYAKKHRLAVVMPSAGKSFYTNTAGGDHYWDYIADEVPQIAQSYFPLSNKYEDNFVAGLSMGGYGALKLALRRPKQFCAAVSLSGIMDIASFIEACDANPNLIPNCEAPNFHTVFGKELLIKDSENDLFYLIKKRKEPLPQCRMYCGDNDFLIEDNKKFHQFLFEQNINCELIIDNGGHEWDFWDSQIEKALEWLPLKHTFVH
ncbi:alpha/beta hydrolase family protein [Oscillospiraceae bacterium PP1C4]